jgi:hypothetical protein
MGFMGLRKAMVQNKQQKNKVILLSLLLPIRAKIVLNDEQVGMFKYMGCIYKS